MRLRTMSRDDDQQQSEQKYEQGHRDAGGDSLDRREAVGY
jgi:hypothetical protein